MATAGVCLMALAFRTPLRSRYWAWQIAHDDDPARRAIYLTALCGAGDAGRWGTSALLSSDQAELRQLGTVVLQHVRSEWARQRLLAALRDPDEGVRELAALGLAMHGDDRVVPTLMEMYRSGDGSSGPAACLALQRLGTPAAVAALDGLAREPAVAARRAALVDALEEMGEPACVPALLALLADHRPWDGPARSERVAQDVLRRLAADARVPSSLPIPETQPAAGTVAERAAAALAKITGLSPPFSSTLPVAEQELAAQRWAAWSAREAGRP